MKRAIIAPMALPAAALAELKQWLGINTMREDALLFQLLVAALDICEGYTGVSLIERDFEEMHAARAPFSPGGWQEVSTRPVQQVVSVTGVHGDGTREVLAQSAFRSEIDANGVGRFRITEAGGATRVSVRYRAGMVTDWASLPEALRHGIVRLAAHHHRSRDAADASVAPPLAVTALWQPWRRMRLT
ncbi:phage head-tail connector protein [Croceicoccus sp. F390]|uniref:Phage head-tail connector protein n=1 Tax=Croceicoccus esteveae TaxID=3075597 RepID=A0ABU2ZM66_9SPHN|nr:phage head-tail connector protein [Croceicoccus sp. F390]MDT0576527.1 phage head-tail connector protein [Croceicoccus sp. F390]